MLIGRGHQPGGTDQFWIGCNSDWVIPLKKYSTVTELFESDCEDALTCLNFPLQHRRRIRTTNSLERFNQEIKRRTRIIHSFPNHDSALRLIGALCMEQPKEWLTGKQYLDMTLLENLDGGEEIERRQNAA